MKHTVSPYEEAKQVIEGYIDGTIARHNLRLLKWHIVLGSAIMEAIVLVLGVAVQDIFTIIVLQPSVGVVALAAYIPYRMYTKTFKEVRDGSYFERKTEEEVIQIANEYLDVCTSYEDKLLEEERNLPLYLRFMNHF